MSNKNNKTYSLSALKKYTDIPESLIPAYDLLHTSHNNEAIQHCRNFLQYNPDHAVAIFLYGIAEAQSGKLVNAIQAFIKVIQIDSTSYIAYDYLGLAYLQSGDRINAAKSFLVADFFGIKQARQQYVKIYRSVDFNSKKQIAQHHIDILLAHARTTEAIEVVIKLLSENKNDTGSWNLLCHVLLYSRFDKKPKQNVIQIISQAFARKQMNFKHMFSAAISAMAYMPGMSQIFFATSGNEQTTKSLQNNLLTGQLKPVLTNALLLSILNKTITADIKLESWLMALRHAFLDIAISETSTALNKSYYVEFMCALSKQCYLNEYVFFISNDEIAKLHTLETILNDTTISAEELGTKMLVLSMYSPLLQHSHHRTWTDIQWPENIDNIITQQIIEPSAERKIRDEIKQATQISAEVSQLVQEQYEENPFPRWDTLPAKVEKISLNKMVTNLFPHISETQLAFTGTANILVAGCGTGWIPVVLSSQIERANITAIDLSLSSLSYAIRKSRELSLTNVQYMQGDILRLRELNQLFDHINCFGVLHHMENIIDGFKVLVDILKPGCTMLIGLYSKIARESIYMARDYIQEKGYEATEDGMRQCRQDIIKLEDGHPMKQLTEAVAFYSMSDFRDLVFHVQEHCITTLELGNILDELKLQFLGFEIHDQHIIRSYRTQFPDDPNMLSLENWHQFEQQNPMTFVATYRFWVKKNQ